MKIFHFLIVPERPESIQKRYGSTARKPAMAGGVGNVSQSNALFTNNCFVPNYGTDM